MKKTLIALACTALVTLSAGCGSSATEPTATLPLSYTFSAALSPANEVPAVTNADASGSGTATITLNVTRDAAGSITAATANFAVALTGFPNATTLTGAHIHQAAAGANAAVIVNTGLANGEVVLAGGAASFTKNTINVPVEVANNLTTTPSAYYFNVHSTLNAGGAARGQLVLK